MIFQKYPQKENNFIFFLFYKEDNKNNIKINLQPYLLEIKIVKEFFEY